MTSISAPPDRGEMNSLFPLQTACRDGCHGRRSFMQPTIVRGRLHTFAEGLRMTTRIGTYCQAQTCAEMSLGEHVVCLSVRGEARIMCM